MPFYINSDLSWFAKLGCHLIGFAGMGFDRDYRANFQVLYCRRLVALGTLVPLDVITFLYGNRKKVLVHVAEAETVRRLAETQKDALAATLLLHKGRQYAIDWSRDNAEVMHFAQDLYGVFSRWVKTGYGPLWIQVVFRHPFHFHNQFGVQWYVSEHAPNIPVHAILGPAFRNCCKIPADGVRWPDPRKEKIHRIVPLYFVVLIGAFLIEHQNMKGSKVRL